MIMNGNVRHRQVSSHIGLRMAVDIQDCLWFALASAETLQEFQYNLQSRGNRAPITEMSDQYSFDDSDEQIVLRRAWQNALLRLRQETPPMWDKMYFKKLVPLSFSDGEARFAAPGQFITQWVEDKFKARIEDLLRDELGEPVTLILETHPQAKGAVQAVVHDAATIVHRPSLSSHQRFRPNPKFTFDNFVVGQSNRMAAAGAKAVVANPGSKFNPLFIYGPNGVGKTHLLHAIANELVRSSPDISVGYVTAQQFAEDFVNALQTNRVDQFRRLQRQSQVWLVDDIQLIAARDKTCEEIFHTFNYLQSLDRQIVICSDRTPGDMLQMDERIRSRFESGLLADILLPDTETRCAIIMSKAAQESIEIEHSVAMYLAENVPGSVRYLEGALTRLTVLASIEGRSIDLAAASKLVEDYYQSSALSKPSVKQIIEAVGRHFRIETGEIRGASRKAPIVQARHVAIYITRELTGDSWKHIGGQFGDRDHSSTMHGYQKVADGMKQDERFGRTVKMLMRGLHPEG